METPPAPFYVFIEHIVQQPQPYQQQPPIHLLRLIPEMGHLNFVARVRRNKYDRLRLPWHFVRSINKCQKNPLHLEINLQASKYQSPAFESTMPEYYFPKCQRVIVVKFSDRKDRHDFVLSLKTDGLILKTEVAHEYVPQTLEFKWEHSYLPQQITKTKNVALKNGKEKFEYIWKQNMCIPLEIPRKLRIDESQVYQLEDIREEQRKFEEIQKLWKAQDSETKDQDSDDDYFTAIGEEDNLVDESEDDYYTAIGEDEDNSIESESAFYTAEDNQQDSSVKSEEEQDEEDYVVFDEKDDLNYPRIVFEIGLGRSEIRPFKFNCKSENPEPTCFERICF